MIKTKPERFILSIKNKLILSLVIFGVSSPAIDLPYYISPPNIVSRRVKTSAIQRMSREEILKPGPFFLASVKGPEAFSQEIKLLPTPQISPDEVLIVPLFSGITGSDIDIYTNVRPTPPGIMGHEVVAQVIKVGERVKGIKIGDIITMNPNHPDNPDDIIGFNGIGFFARVFKIPERFVKHKEETIFNLPLHVSFFNALFTEMLATVHFAQDVIREDIKDKIIVVDGAGPAGILHILLAKKLGAKKVIVLEKDSGRLEHAIKEGFIEEENAILVDETTAQKVIGLTGGKGAEVVIIATSDFRTAQWALDYINKNAIINLYGKIREGSRILFKDGTVFDAYKFYKERQPGKPQITTVLGDGKKIKFVLTRGERQEDFVQSLELIKSAEINPLGMITHVISLEAIPEVLAKLTEGYRLNDEVEHKVIVDTRLKGKQILSIDKYLQLFGQGQQKLIQLESLAELSEKIKPNINLFQFSEERFFPSVITNLLWEYRKAIMEDKELMLFLSGGSSLLPLKLLVETEYRSLIDWNKVKIFFTDERMGIPLNDKENNAQQA
ncbi:MAG: alcohol dehydrogenase catalytic domain-containing protein, partial [Candidatus Omnitrophota bacterium]